MKLGFYCFLFAIWTGLILWLAAPMYAGSASYSQEGNEAAATATEVSTYDSITDIVGPNDQFDWFIIDTGYGAQAGGEIVVTCFEPGLAVRLYQRTSGVDTQLSEKSTSENIHQIIFDLDSMSVYTGTFLLRVTYYSANATAHPYNADFSIYAEGCLTDYNNSAATAYELSLGTSASEYICADDPVDWYKINVSSSDDGAVLALIGDIDSVNMKVMSGLTKPATQVYRGSAGSTADAFYTIDMSTLGKGTYYIVIESNPYDDATHFYTLYYATKSYLGLPSDYALPHYVLNPDPTVHYDWEKNYPWEKNPPIALGPWPRIGGNPANNNLTARPGPMNPSSYWDKQLTMKGSTFKVDVGQLVDTKGKINLESLLKSQIPSITTSFENLTPEPMIDSANGVIIASGTKDYGDLIKKVTVYGIDAKEGDILWTLDEVSSNGQLLLGPHGTFYTPGGGKLGLTGDSGISCVSSTLGDVIWSVDSPRTIIELNALNGTYFIGSDGETIRAYSYKDGSVGWSWAEKGKAAPRSLASDGAGNAYGNIAGTLYKFDSSGTLRYRSLVAAVDSKLPMNSKTVCGPGGRVYMADTRGNIYCCKGGDGTKLWSYPKEANTILEKDNFGLDLGGVEFGGVRLDFGDILDLGDVGDLVNAKDLGDLGDFGDINTIIKQFDKLDMVRDMACTPSGYLVAAFRKRLIVLDINGNLVAERKLDLPIGSGLTVDGSGVIYIGMPTSSKTYRLEAMDYKLNTIWTMDNTGQGSRMIIDMNGRCYTLGGDNVLHCFGQ